MIEFCYKKNYENFSIPFIGLPVISLIMVSGSFSIILKQSSSFKKGIHSGNLDVSDKFVSLSKPAAGISRFCLLETLIGMFLLLLVADREDSTISCEDENCFLLQADLGMSLVLLDGTLFLTILLTSEKNIIHIYTSIIIHSILYDSNINYNNLLNLSNKFVSSSDIASLRSKKNIDILCIYINLFSPHGA